MNITSVHRWLNNAHLWLMGLLIVLIAVSLPHDASALNQIDTGYFSIIYDEHGEYTAGEIAKFCDEIYEKLMARYGSFTDDPRVICIVNDAIDLANGYALYYQNTITIFATNMDFELRGQTNWLKNVFVHEMTHMIALKKAAKGPISFLALGGGRFNQNPDLGIFIALYHLSQPEWFSEGTAQVGAEKFGAERWDTNRDMVLRTAWYDNALLSFDDMSVLSGQKGMEAEMVYNQGYSMSRYIMERYGYDKLVELNNSCGLFDFDPTVKNSLGITSQQLYSDWLASLDKRYASFKNRDFDEGEMVEDRGSMDFFPVVSPDGRYLAWLSNRGRDYAIMDLMLKDLSTGKTRKVAKNVDYRISWSHDSGEILYVKRPPGRPNFYDIYTYDLRTKKEKRVSRQMRARDPAFSPGDSLIVFVRNEAGNNALAVINSDGTGLRYLSATHDGTQFYKPSFSPDGSQIVFGLFRQNLDRDIGIIDTGGRSYRYKWDVADSTSGYSDSTSFAEDSNFRLLLGSKYDESDPCFLPEGNGIIYVTDRTGVFNVYKLDFKTNRTTRLTDLYGGAFCPSNASGGDVYYAGYKAKKFSIYRTSVKNKLEESKPVVEERDYLEQVKRFDLSENFDIKTVSRKRILNAVVPILNLGPSFIGSRFGLNVLDVGAEVYVSDLLGYDAFIFSGSVGKNLKEDVSLNNRFSMYYQRRMAPVTSSTYTHSPTIYMGASRSVINNHIQRFSGLSDTVFISDRPDVGYENVLHNIHQEMDVSDKYLHEFRSYNMGVHIPLASRHSFFIEAGYRQYYETLKRLEEIQDYSSFISSSMDITHEFEGARKKYIYDTRFFTDMEYFRSGEFSLIYNYLSMEPTADSDISPQGTSVLVGYRHLRTVIADSLINQVSLLIPYGMYDDGYFAMEEYIPDPFLDELRPYKKNLDVNEYTLILQRNQGLPYLRHVLNGIAYVAYRDVRLKDPWQDEGYGYNWPLKFYLGGSSILSGYPYFAFWGSKMFYSRFDYVFPIKQKISKNFLGLHFQRLYGSAFFEAGKTWNFHRLSMDNLREGSFKRDVGFELRLKMVSFYRLPTFFTAKIVWPLDGMGDSYYRTQRDARRIYFGLRM
ncbi:hypothetical protein ACFL1R_10190 [Candidatus Latescibacterota bacterium]